MPITPNRTTAVSLITVTLVLLTLSSLAAYGGEPLGFGGVSLGDSEAEVLSVFPDADCRSAPELKPPYRCFVKALAWGGVPPLSREMPRHVAAGARLKRGGDDARAKLEQGGEPAPRDWTLTDESPR